MLTVLLYLVGFLKTLIFLVFVFLMVRFFKQLLAPQASGESKEKKTNRRKEGETTIRFNRKGEKIINKDEGEYVEFEEVDKD